MGPARSQAIQRFLNMGRYDAKKFFFGVGAVDIPVDAPTDIGAVYLVTTEFPLSGKNIPQATNVYTATFRAAIETNDNTGPYTAQLDLYDANGALNLAVPQVVPGSQLVTDAMAPTIVTADLSAYFFPGNSPSVWVLPGLFIARLSIQTVLAGKVVTCKMAELVFDW